MVSVETATEPSGPRISFSADFLDDDDDNDDDFISINPHRSSPDLNKTEKEKAKVADFEFLSSNNNVGGGDTKMMTADELFFEGKLLPFWKTQHAEKLNKISLKSKEEEEGTKSKEEQQQRVVSWFVDDDPSPRPPNCTVLWKELLRLRKHRSSSHSHSSSSSSSSNSSSLSPSSSSSSTSSSSSSMADAAKKEQEGKDVKSKEKINNAKRVKKGLERSRSGNIRIRPMINMPICTQAKSAALPPLFPLKKGRLER